MVDWPRGRWQSETNPRHDVLKKLPFVESGALIPGLTTRPLEYEFNKFLHNYFNDLRTQSYLDSTGWSQKGRMGWFGVSQDEDVKKYTESFVELQSGNQEDWIVAVDCHI